MHVQAVGHVVVEDGKQRRQGNEATVEFNAPDPVSTLKNSRFLNGALKKGKRGLTGLAPFLESPHLIPGTAAAPKQLKSSRLNELLEMQLERVPVCFRQLECVG